MRAHASIISGHHASIISSIISGHAITISGHAITIDGRAVGGDSITNRWAGQQRRRDFLMPRLGSTTATQAQHTRS
jgi:hypothetical protein